MIKFIKIGTTIFNKEHVVNIQRDKEKIYVKDSLGFQHAFNFNSMELADKYYEDLLVELNIV